MKNILFILLIANSFLISTLNAQQLQDTISRLSFSETKQQQDFNKGFVAEPLQLITGKVSGLSITRTGSDPNIFSSIRIRGISSNFSLSPLWIIDGVWDADPQFLIPNEIETIEILKDAVETAAFGSRGMGGVIVVTTKTNTGNKPISVDVSVALSLNTVSKRMDLLTAGEIRSFVDENNISFTDGGADTDWQNEIFRNTLAQTYNIATHGQVKNTAYRLSFNHQQNAGIVKETDRNNTGLGFKISQKAFNDRLNINATTGLKMGTTNTIPDYLVGGSSNIFYQAYYKNPTDPIFESDGTTYAEANRGFNMYNPLAIMNFTENESTTDVFNYSVNANYKILNGLAIDFNLGHSLANYKEEQNAKPGMEHHGIQERSYLHDSESERLNFSPAVTFNKTYNLKHKIDVRAGYQYGLSIYKYSEWLKTTTDENEYDGYLKQIFSAATISAGYEYDNRYLLRASWQNESYTLNSNVWDQNSPDPFKRTNQYPAVMAGWRIHNESFLNEMEFISNLILKAGLGYSGNSNFHRLYLDTQTEDLETERMQELSAGIDFGLWNNRINGSFVYYSRSVNNALGQHMQSRFPASGYETITNNDYHYKNHGLEMSMNALVYNNAKISWNTAFVYFRNNNEMVSGLILDNYRTGRINYYLYPDESYTQTIQHGDPFHVFYLPVFAELSADGAELFYTETGTLTREYLIAHRENMGQLTPKQELGWVNNFTLFQHFNLELSFRYVGGHSIYNATRMNMSNSYMIFNHNAIPEAITNFNIGKQYNKISNLYLEDASYLRLDYLTLGYTLKPQQTGLESNLKLYISANNVFTITKYTGLDPAYTPVGIDSFNVYPLSRSFVLGVKMGI